MKKNQAKNEVGHSFGLPREETKENFAMSSMI
jgi:hypothetical protein